MLRQNLKFLLVFAVGYFMVYALSSHVQRSEQIGNTRSSVLADYSMGKAETTGAPLDLSGRAIRKQVLGGGHSNEGPQPQGAAAAVTPGKGGSPQGSKPAVAAKGKNAKKDAKKTAQKKKPKLDVAVTDTRARTRSALPTSQDTSNNNAYAGQAALNPINETQEELPNPTGPVAKESTKTASDWRALLFATPTNAKAAEFIMAFRRSEVSGSDFYKITEELLKDSTAQRQDVAVYILVNDYSAYGFKLAAMYSEREVSASLKTKLIAVLDGYARANKYSALAETFKSKEASVVNQAIRVLTLALNSQGNSNPQTPGSGGRDQRGLAEEPLNPASLQLFVPQLQALQSSQNEEWNRAAQDLLSRIQTLIQS